MGERAIEALKALGLTEQETRAYLALVTHGELTAREVSMLSGIPYSKIYGVLERLRDRGWISVGPGRPKRYSALPPVEAARKERLRREEELRALEECVVGELQPLYERSRAVERPDIWIIRGLDGVLSKIRDVLSRARREVLLAIPLAAKGILSSVEPSIMHLRFSGVEVRILAPEELRDELSHLSGLADVRFKSGMFGGGLIVDGREAVLVLARSGSVMAIWSDYAELAHIAEIYFEHLWGSG